MCDLDTPLNGLLLHSDTLCLLRNHLDDDPQWSGEDGQEKTQEADHEKTQEDGQEEEEAEQENCPSGTTAPPSGTTVRAVLPP